MSQPLISVIMPVYKVEKYLDTCVQSLVSQSYKNLEIILVDDGSPDRSGELCDRWAEKDPRVRVIHKANSGPSDARNAGLEIATGEFIAYADSDDILHPEMYERLLSVMEQQQADIVECDYREFFDGTEPELPDCSDAITAYDPESALNVLISGKEFRYLVWNKLYRRRIMGDLRFLSGKIHEDVFYVYQVFDLCKKIVKLHCPLYLYRQWPESIMGTAFSMKRLDSLEARLAQIDFLRPRYPKLLPAATLQYLGSCLYYGQMALRSSDKAMAKQAISLIRPQFLSVHKGRSCAFALKQELWFTLAGLSFSLCCKIRNFLRIGI